MSRSTEDDRVAVVTGANSGIGSAIAVALAGQGVAVVVHYLDGPPPSDPDHTIEHEVAGRAAADDVVGRIVEAGGRAVAVPGDPSAPDAVRGLFGHAERAFGPVGILVNNAAH